MFVGRAKQLGSDSLLNDHVHLRSKWLELNLKKDKRRRKKKEIAKHRNGVSENPDNSRYGVKINIESFCFNYTFRYYIAGKQPSLLALQDALFAARRKIGSESGREICQKSETTLRPILAQGLVISRGG